MSNYATLKAAVQSVVKSNGNKEITGTNMQSTLLGMITSLASGYLFKGMATPSTSPGTPDENVFYIGGAGTYENFGSTAYTVNVGSIGVFRYNGSWSRSQLKLLDGIDDYPTAGSVNAVKSSGIFSELLKKVSIVPSTNLINPNDPNNLYGYGIGSNGQIKSAQANIYFVTNYIPVNGQNISIYTSYINNWSTASVYDANFGYLRTLGSSMLYEYESGDAYIRIFCRKTYSGTRANYGSTLLPYKPWYAHKQIEDVADACAENTADIQLDSMILTPHGETLVCESGYSRVDLVSDRLVTGSMVCVTLQDDANSPYSAAEQCNIQVNGIVAEGGATENIGLFRYLGQQSFIKLTKDYSAIAFYAPNQTAGFTVNISVDAGVYEDYLTRLATSGCDYTFRYKKIELNAPELVTAGNTVSFTLTGEIEDSLVSVYEFFSDDSYANKGNLREVGDRVSFTVDDNVSKIRLWNNNTDSAGYSVNISVNSLEQDVNELKREVVGIQNITGLRILILGDSYSQMGYWVDEMMANLPQDSSVVNLGVTSCKIRNYSNDLQQYPYTSRPAHPNNSGNLNVLACQVEKLKRLMEGTDLDAGESQIYTTPDEYPNVIILEGGMNDNHDSDEVEETYFDQFRKQVTNVYRKDVKNDTVSVGDMYIKTPIDEVDKTNFAGAYRNVAEELLDLFPKAQIFITTAANMGYWTYDVPKRRYITAVQQRKCANLLSASVIDWEQDGQINCILDCPKGSGTQADPYQWNCSSLNTTDLLHPNTKGAKKYGRLAAMVIKQRYMDIYSFL